MNNDRSISDSPSLLANNVDPVVRGFVKDWDAMEDLLHHILYNGLGWEIGNEGQIFICISTVNPKENLEELLRILAIKEQLVQLMFETFNISGFYASKQAVLSLYAVGRISSNRGRGSARVIRKLDMSEVEKLKEQYACYAEDDITYGKTLESCLEEKHTLLDGQQLHLAGNQFTSLTMLSKLPNLEVNTTYLLVLS
uniref:Actin-related protein 7 n=1 Tax=Tanacetum cinerariifolium TaxID=118510 RepID=A0A6L2NND4_TANCI|nr:actin-related protein 7 [Tanacetum cinerariifolium]